jgi:hypothetical protein
MLGYTSNKEKEQYVKNKICLAQYFYDNDLKNTIFNISLIFKIIEKGYMMNYIFLAKIQKNTRIQKIF